MRLIYIFLGLAVLLLIPFAIFGDMGIGENKSIAFLQGYGQWAWAVAFAMLAADLVLPIPATAIISASGYIYGPFIGAIIGATGSFIAANIAYWICRGLGQKTAERLVGRKDLIKGEKLFRAWGGWMVTLSRWLPLFPEVLSCLAGLTRMPWNSFAVATLCGVIPLSTLFAWIGHMGQDFGVLAILLSAGLPPLFWLSLHRYMSRKIAAIDASDNTPSGDTQ